MKSDFESSLLMKIIKVNYKGNEKEMELNMKYDLFLNKIALLFGLKKDEISNYLFYYYNNLNKITISNEEDFENFKNNFNNNNDIIIYIENKNLENSNIINVENNNKNNLINNNPINQNFNNNINNNNTNNSIYNNNININNNNINNNDNINKINNNSNNNENKNIMNNINNNLPNQNFNSNISNNNFNINNQNSNISQNVNNNNSNINPPVFQFNMSCALCHKFPIIKIIYFCPWCRNFLCEECEERTSIYHFHPLFKIKNSFQFDHAIKININTIIENTKKGMKNMFDSLSNFFSNKNPSSNNVPNTINYNKNNFYLYNANNPNNNMNSQYYNNNNMSNINMNNQNNNNNNLDNKKMKINQMKQLYSLDNISDEKIEEALIKSNWNFDEAIIYLVSN